MPNYNEYLKKYGLGQAIWTDEGKITINDDYVHICPYSIVGFSTHRLEGPTYIFKNGEILWFINGRDVTKDIQRWAEENEIDLDNLSEYDKNMIKIVWG